MQVHGSSGESVEAVIRLDAAAARSAPSAIAFDGWAMVSVLTMRARPASRRRVKASPANTGWLATSNGGGSDNRRRCARVSKIGRAHVCTPVTNAHLVCSLLLE